jgi:hypothetical protein
VRPFRDGVRFQGAAENEPTIDLLPGKTGSSWVVNVFERPAGPDRKPRRIATGSVELASGVRRWAATVRDPADGAKSWRIEGSLAGGDAALKLRITGAWGGAPVAETLILARD